MGLYAAYGSNMDPAQMLQRCPASPHTGTGWIPGWRLTFGAEEHGWDGALATLVGDALTLLPTKRMLYAIGAFFLSHLLYTLYFASQMTLSLFWPVPLTLLIIGGLVIAAGQVHIGRQAHPVAHADCVLSCQRADRRGTDVDDIGHDSPSRVGWRTP